MEKEIRSLKCDKCGLEFPESELSEEHKDRAFVWDSELLCKDCLMMMGGDPLTAHTWWDQQHDVNKAKKHDW